MKLIIRPMQFFPPVVYFLCLKSKYFPEIKVALQNLA
jgi:hypothetical protein